MSIIQGTSKAAGGAGYEIDQSIRFDNVAGVNAGGAQMYRLALTGTPTNDKKATISAWVKRGNLAGWYPTIAYSGDPNGATAEVLRFNIDNTLTFAQASSVYNLTTTQVFRDVGAWYHIVAEIDTANGTSADRANLYVNGVKMTSFSTATYPSLNYVTNWTASSGLIAHTWGSNAIPAAGPSSQLFAGYMAEMYVLDGEKAGATAFGEFNDSGVWIPTAYSGAFGNNGYYMTGETASALGEDFSGNNLDFTTVALATTDQMLDTPTLNASTFNPLWAGAGLSDGNLVATATGNAYQWAISTFAVDDGGKYVCELQKSSGTFGYIGLYQMGNHSVTSGNNYGYFYNLGTGEIVKNGSAVTDLGTGAANSLMRLEYNSATDTLEFFDDGASIHSATTGLTGQNSLHFGCAPYGSGTKITATFQGLSGTPTADFLELTSANLATPSITDGSAYFDTKLWTGDDVDGRAITGYNFQPDWVWIKSRSGAYSHNITDAVRGAGNFLISNATDAEVAGPDVFGSTLAFTSDGFTLDNGTLSNLYVNAAGVTYAGWGWEANGSGSSNEDGSINTTATSANTTAGFSISTYTGNGTAGATVGHGLGVVPKMILIKSRDSAEGWYVYHEATGNTKVTILNTTSAAVSDGAWNNTTPTSSVFTLGTSNPVNRNADDFVAYCFAEILGYSSIGSYTGNGSTDGPFVYTGFRPSFVLCKNTINAGNDWPIDDAARSPFNPDKARLWADLSTAENTGSVTLDLLSNGFKIRTSNGEQNTSGSTHMYMAFAENPFGGDGVAPATAR
jgi:hypothetical protein